MNQKLHDVVARSHAITQAIIEAGGELSPELEAELEQVDLDLADKVDAYKYVTDRLTAEEKFFKAKADELYKVGQAHAKASARIKERLKEAMLSMERADVYGNEYRWRLTPLDPKLVIEDGVISDEWKKEVIEMVVDKDLIKTALAKGEEIEGARMEPVHRLQAYPNRSTK